MATAPQFEHDEALEEQTTSKKALEKVFKRAMARFDASVLPQLEQRSLCLIARRFVNIPGAMWEGEFGQAFSEDVRLEIPLLKEGIDKIKRDYNEHRIVPDFRPAGNKGDDESATTLDGMHRADAHNFGSDEAWDTAFGEGVDGGFGAYRLTNEWADPYDKDSDHQRINPGLTITDADQRVFFGPSDRYDKSDAPYAFLITGHDRTLWEEDNPDATIPADFNDNLPSQAQFDWFSNDVVKTAEYWEVDDVEEKLYVCTQILSGQQERYWDSEIEDEDLSEMRKLGWKVETRKLKRKRVHKYLLSGSEVLKDYGLIAGDRVPIVPFYGKRTVVDGVERFEGYTQARMDVQRLYNIAVTKLAETSSMSGREIPIFAAEQMPPHLAEQWANQVVERHAYALVNPLIDPQTGNIVSAGPIGKVEAPQVDPSTAAIVQIARNDLTEDQQDGSEEAKANTSEEALAFAATRVDAKSGIYLDNWAKSTRCGGDIYLGMCADIYFEPLREVDTMDEDGNEGTAELIKPYVDGKGVTGYQNDFTRGHYKVIVDVTEATSTRREKTVRSCLGIAQAADAAGDAELGSACRITAIANMDGEGMTDLQKYARRKGVSMGLLEPTDEEKAQMEEAAQNQQPDPTAVLADAQAKALEAGAQKDLKLAEKADADTELSKAKVVDTIAHAHAQQATAKWAPFKPLTDLFKARKSAEPKPQQQPQQ